MANDEGPWTKYQTDTAKPWEKYQQRPWTKYAADITESAGTGVLQGAASIPGIPGDIKSGVNWAADKLLGPVPEKSKPRLGAPLPTTADIQGGMQRAGIPFHQPETAAGRYAQSVGQVAPYAAAGPGGLLRKGLQSTAIGVGSEFGRSKAEGTSWEIPAQLAGGVAGAVVGSGVRNVLGGDLLGRDARGRVLPDLPLTHDEEISRLNENLVKLTTAGQADMMEASKALDAFPNKDPLLQEKFHGAGELDPQFILSPEEQTLWDQHFAAAKLEEAENHRWLISHGAPIEEGEQISPIDPGYMRRPVAGTEAGPAEAPTYGPTEGVNPLLNPLPTKLKARPSRMATTTPSMKERTYFSIENDEGERRLVEKRDGDWKVVGGGNLPLLKKEAKLGDIFSGPDRKDWTLKHAYTREIESGTKLRYHKNALANLWDNIIRQRAAKRNVQFLEKFKDTEWFRNSSNKSPVQGWKETNHPNFKGLYMKPEIAEALDDFAGRDYSEWEKNLTAANRFMINSLFWSPIPHAANVFGHYFQDRGWDNFTPEGLKRAARALPVAAREVMSGGSIYRQHLKAGGALIRGTLDNQNFYAQMLRKFGQTITREPGKWEAISNRMGLGPVKNLVSHLYDMSNRALWTAGDIMTLSRYLELEMGGMSMENAIRETHKHIPDYRIPTRVLGRRDLSEFLQNPAFGQFNRYHYGVMKSWANTIGDLVGAGKLGTAQEQFKAIGEVASIALLISVVNPGLSAAIQWFSNDKNLRIKDYGPLAPVAEIGKVSSGEHDITRFTQSVFSVAPMTKLLIESITGKNTYTGKDIFTRDLNAPASKTALHQMGQGLERLAEIGFSPYQTFNEGWKDKQTGLPVPESIAKAFIAQGFDINTRKEGIQPKARKAIRREYKASQKNPPGPIQSYIDKGLNLLYRREIPSNAQ